MAPGLGSAWNIANPCSRWDRTNSIPGIDPAAIEPLRRALDVRAAGMTGRLISSGSVGSADAEFHGHAPPLSSSGPRRPCSFGGCHGGAGRNLEGLDGHARDGWRRRRRRCRSSAMGRTGGGRTPRPAWRPWHRATVSPGRSCRPCQPLSSSRASRLRSLAATIRASFSTVASTVNSRLRAGWSGGSTPAGGWSDLSADLISARCTTFQRRLGDGPVCLVSAERTAPARPAQSCLSGSSRSRRAMNSARASSTPASRAGAA